MKTELEVPLWGRYGFDGSMEVTDACRGAVGLVKQRQKHIRQRIRTCSLIN